MTSPHPPQHRQTELVFGNRREFARIAFDGTAFTSPVRDLQASPRSRPALFMPDLRCFDDDTEVVFNHDMTRFIETSPRSGISCKRIDESRHSIEVGRVRNGGYSYMRTLSIPGSPSPGQAEHRLHRAVLDPTGRFFVVPNAGGDTLLVVDTHEDLYRITNDVSVPRGVGPRRVAFLENSGAVYMVMLGELSNELFLYEVGYGDEIDLYLVDRISTFHGPSLPRSSKAAAVELVIADDREDQEDIYVLNQFTGAGTDQIVHFKFKQDTGFASFEYVCTTSSHGLVPSALSLSIDDDQEFLFVGNAAGESGLVAFRRDPMTGTLDPTPVATVSNEKLAAAGCSADDLGGFQVVETS